MVQKLRRSSLSRSTAASFVRLLLAAALVLSAASAFARQSVGRGGSVSADAQEHRGSEAKAGPTTTLTGTVRTASGEAIPGAAVRATRSESNQAWVTWTDESGNFEFPLIPAGHYTIAAEQLGFVKTERSMQVAARLSPPPIRMTLRVATLADLENPGGSSRPENRFAGRPGRKSVRAAPQMCLVKLHNGHRRANPAAVGSYPQVWSTRSTKGSLEAFSKPI
jgi:hypothetical protein